MSTSAPSPARRIAAAFIDWFIISVIIAISATTLSFIPILGGLLSGVIGIICVAFKDAIPIPELQGASPGKKVMGLRAQGSHGDYCSYEDSIKRNAPFVLPQVIGAIVGIIPVLGFLVQILVIPILSVIILLAELMKIMSDPQGIRFGDAFAGTKVIEVSEPMFNVGNSPGAQPESSPQPQAPPPPPPIPTPPQAEESTEEQK